MVARLRGQTRDRRTQGTQGREASQQGDKMSRNRILATGAVLWTIAAADALVHLAAGDWMAPALMGVVGIVGAGWIVLRHGRRSLTVDA